MNLEQKILWDFYCFQCSLQFEKKSIYDLHLTLIHNYNNKTDTSDHETKSEPDDVESSNHTSYIESKFAKEQEWTKKVDSNNEKERLLKCQFCEKSFSRKSGLTLHVSSVHEGKKPYKCESCNHSFSRKRGLTHHVSSVHEGKKPYKLAIMSALKKVA